MVDGLIKDVIKIMEEGKITAQNSLPKAGQRWWQKLFGSK
jgi:hypothetical protein